MRLSVFLVALCSKQFKMLIAFLSGLLILLPFTHAANIQSADTTDSYLSAYSEVHGGKLDILPNVKNDRDYSVLQDVSTYSDGPFYRPDFPYPNSSPVSQYGPPRPAYGPPKPLYGPPKPEYGPPKPEYGPPTQRFE